MLSELRRSSLLNAEETEIYAEIAERAITITAAHFLLLLEEI